MKNDITVTAKTVLDFLGIKYQRFNLWIKNDVLGLSNPTPGSGYDREFSSQDVAAAKIAAAVMGIAKDFTVAKEVVRMFRQGCPSMDNPSLLIQFTGEKFHFSWIANKYTVADYPSLSVIIIPVASIMQEVEKLFAGLEAKKEAITV